MGQARTLCLPGSQGRQVYRVATDWDHERAGQQGLPEWMLFAGRKNQAPRGNAGRSVRSARRRPRPARLPCARKSRPTLRSSSPAGRRGPHGGDRHVDRRRWGGSRRRTDSRPHGVLGGRCAGGKRGQERWSALDRARRATRVSAETPRGCVGTLRGGRRGHGSDRSAGSLAAARFG
jgi:hypothetical protein